jgi:hypothetical protein
MGCEVKIYLLIKNSFKKTSNFFLKSYSELHIFFSIYYYEVLFYFHNCINYALTVKNNQ